MSPRPYVLVSCAVSVDGYLDDATDQRLLLSNDEDFQRVDELRATVDAILVGANTIRRDDPRLVLRASHGSRSPTKVTVTTRGDLDPAARFFTTGDPAVAKLVYCASPQVATVQARLGEVATVVDAGNPGDLRQVLADLGRRGVGRLMVEGGSEVLAQFFTGGLVDELQLAIAPIFVGDHGAPRFTGPNSGTAALRLDSLRRLGDVVVLRYLLRDDAGA